MSDIEITFNGELTQVSSGTVEELLSEFKLAGKKLAVELNREIVSRSSFAETQIQQGDSVEIVQFVGGG